MKLLVVVALFAFVAVKLSHAAPAPEDEKKEEPAPESKVAADAPSSVAPAVTEVRSSPESSPDTPTVPAETPAPAA